MAGLVTACAISGCQSSSPPADQVEGKTTTNVIAISAEAAKNLKLKTETVARRDLGHALHVPGKIQPEISKEVEVSPRFSGRVVKICATLGSRVAPGQGLAEVDSQVVGEMQADLVKATAELGIAKAHEERERQIYEENKLRPKNLIDARTHYQSIEVELELAQADFKRIESLYKEKIAPLKDFLAAEANLERLKVTLKAAGSELHRQESLYKNKAMLRRDLQLAEAETARAQQHVNMLKQRLIFLGMPGSLVNQIQRTGKIMAVVPIVAPQSGVVTEQLVAMGEMCAPEKKLFTIADLSTVVVTADIPEVDLRYVRLGGPVNVKVTAYPEATFHGTVQFISENVDTETRAVPIRALLENSDGRLKSHMFAEIDVLGESAEVLACPTDALQERDGKTVVYVATADGSFQERSVRTGKSYKNYVEILDGLKEGEKVATKGSLLLKTAMRHENIHD